jgi:colanic acid/amylovoran biosynthesis glycosyltransferase
MKIAFLVDGFPKLSETFILNQITGLIDLGHRVEIFARFNPKEEQVHSEVVEYQLRKRTHYISPPKSNLKKKLKLLYLIIISLYKNPITIFNSIKFIVIDKKGSFNQLYFSIPFIGKSYDVLLCHFGPNGNIGIGLRDLKVIDCKIVTTFHAYDLTEVILKQGESYYKDLFLKGDVFLPISNFWKKKLIYLGCPEGKIKVHHMGIDTKRFDPVKRIFKPGDAFKILTLGRLTEKKGHRIGIKAFKRLIENHKNVKYIIAGDGPLRLELESMVLDLGIETQVEFLGPVTGEVASELYKKVHVLLLPSLKAKNGDMEGIPLVLMEAQATGLPVVSSFHSGIPELVIDGKTGFLVPESDVEAITKKLEYLIEHSELMDSMGREGRKKVENEFNIESLNQELVTILQNFI